MTPAANVKCPRDCSGRLRETNDPQTHRCSRCGNELRQVVVDELNRFERVAASGGPAAPIARAALGVDVEGDR